MCAAGSRPRRSRPGSRSTRDLPRPKCCIGADGEVVGVATGDMGVGRDGKPKDSFTRGMELRAKYTLFGEGARGQLTKLLIARFSLDRDREPQKFGIGIKELWQVAPDRHKPGLVQHYVRLAARQPHRRRLVPLSLRRRSSSVGFVVHLNYENPYLSPFEEFQRFKTHPLVRDTFAGGKRIGYGARAIAEGGWQSVPKLVFPGGALIGDGAGFLNVPRIKGTHNAMRVRHARGRTRRRRARRRAQPRRARRLRGGMAQLGDRPATCGRCATPSRCGRSSAPWPASGSAASTCGPTRSASRRSARSATASPTRPASSLRQGVARSPIPSPTASSPSIACPRCSCPTPITRRTSRFT